MCNIRRIISGGQTGADRAGLDFAIENGLETGGYVPRDRMAEDGQISERYKNLIETKTEDPSVRTELNVLAGDATIIFSHGELAGGSLLTRHLAEQHKKPFIHIDLSAGSRKNNLERVKKFLASSGWSIVNIAGPRSSEDPQIYTAVKNFLELLFGDNKIKERGD
jgi:hypothetical protein